MNPSNEPWDGVWVYYSSLEPPWRWVISSPSWCWGPFLALYCAGGHFWFFMVLGSSSNPVYLYFSGFPPLLYFPWFSSCFLGIHSLPTFIPFHFFFSENLCHLRYPKATFQHAYSIHEKGPCKHSSLCSLHTGHLSGSMDTSTGIKLQVEIW